MLPQLKNLPHSQTHQPNNDMRQITVQVDESVIFIFTQHWASQRQFSFQNNSVHTDRFKYSKPSKEMRRGKGKGKKTGTRQESGWWSSLQSLLTLFLTPLKHCRKKKMKGVVIPSWSSTRICNRNSRYDRYLLYQLTYIWVSLRDGGGSQPRYAPLMKQYCKRVLKHRSCREIKFLIRWLQNASHQGKHTFLEWNTYPNENVGVSNDYKQGFGTSDGYVETFGIWQKAERTLQIVHLYWFIRAHLGFQRIKRTLGLE